MKKLYLLMMMAPLLCMCMQLSYAQKTCTSKNENGTLKTVQVSEGYKIKELGDDMYMTYKEHMPGSLSCKETPSLTTHTLTINFEGNVMSGILSNGEDLYYLESTFQEVVSEGYYDIVMAGLTGDNHRCFLIYDQLHIISDTTFNFSTEEAVNKLTLTAVDENGTNISVLNNIELFLPEICLNMHYSIQACFVGSLTGQYLDHYEEIPVYFNNFGNRCSVNTYFQFTTTDSKYYYLLQDAITEGLTSDSTVTDHLEDLVSHSECFNISADNPDTLHLGWKESLFYHYAEGENNGMTGSLSYPGAAYTRSNPLTVITNTKIIDNPQPGDITFMIEPFIYFRQAGIIFPYFVFYDASLSSFEWALNSEGKIVKEPFGFPHTTMTRLMNENYTNITPLTPAVNIYNPEIPIYYGYRAP
ncbi:MAG: hypothetical protein M0P58_10555, partial [Bacteroidales bacterium]|nr:hypothetical protein [Bacteroidales bacterium]